MICAFMCFLYDCKIETPKKNKKDIKATSIVGGQKKKKVYYK
jgi:hypothetical protein